MTNRCRFVLAACLLAFATAKVRADVYTDATNDLFTIGAPQLDIASVTVTNDSTNLYFTINLVGNPILTNWGSYAIAFVTGPGGATNGNGSGAAINLTEGINYWATSLGWGSQMLYQYNFNTQSWSTNSSRIGFANSSNSVSLTVPYAGLGLTVGASFQFDAYTFSSTGGAVDDLANPVQTVNWWSIPYTNDLVENYTISLPSMPASGMQSITVLEDTNTIIWRNPGKGWVYYGTSFPTSQPASIQAMINVLYFRPTWATIEPTENNFNWAYIDDAITSAKNNGVKVAFGFMNADVEPYITPNATPQWVFNAGASYYIVGTNGGYAGTNFTVPYWTNNPVFFAKMNAFITALGQRYNGNTNIAWIDVRNFGEWGEGHLGNISTDTNGRSIGYPSVGDLETNYFLPYLNAFPSTQLVIPWGTASYNPAYVWAVQQGTGMRRDGIPDWNNGSDITFASGYGPGVIEYSDGYDNLVSKGIWNESVVAADILRAKASYSEISWGSFLPTETNFMAGLQNQIGYHFVLQNVTIPQWLSSVSPNALTMNWTNKGVTCLYEPCSVAMALLDGGNNVVGKSWLAGVNPELNWAPGPISMASTMSFNGVPSGNYQLAVGLFTSTNQTQPNFQLGNQGRTANGWYVITNIALLNLAQPATNPTNLTAVLSNGQLSISWPADHIGWTLQMQTNDLSSGLGTNWVTVANSTMTNQMTFPIIQSKSTAFFRLKY
jgi:hypothetical protein